MAGNPNAKRYCGCTHVQFVSAFKKNHWQHNKPRKGGYENVPENNEEVC